MAMKKVAFTRMDAGTKADFELLLAHELEEKQSLPQRVLGLLRSLDHDDTGYRVNRFEHSLQTATRAARDDANEETVVCALLHDIGDLYAPHNHSAFAAAALKPYISNDNHWLVLHHGVFQGYYFMHHLGGDRDARERFRGHPCFEATADFCERWDQKAFDPDYETMPLTAFEPMVRRLFAGEPNSFF